ncbi:hypothetical protein DSO57_1002310 [Entomophthora muscae]|uniref:Uncharacterized protein n=1 Tax=Entomophthora muscae TaxID=34485 RepID=A0ACC2UHT1_9FUNG|nr:hypothetical protein DSO57_1002310 [Entomophthora muscae]
MHRSTLLLKDLSSLPTPRSSSILQRSSPVTTEIGLALTPYTTQSSEEGKITSSPTVDQSTIFYQPALSPSVPPLVNKTSALTLLSLSDTLKSPTVLVTIHEHLGKIKVLALLDTSTNANLIEEKLANLIGLPSFRSLDVKVGNSTLTGTTPILQPVTINLEGSPFCVMCNSSPNLSFLFILRFPWLRESLLNFDHPNNNISFTCNDIVKLYNPGYFFR